MIIPVRCIQCKMPVSCKYIQYKNMTKDMPLDEDRESVFIKLRMKRDCCRQLFLTHVDIIDELILYKTENTS